MQRALILEYLRRYPIPPQVVDRTKVSYFCEPGAHLNHNHCQVVWCKCPCHDHGEFCMYGGL